ncbi:MAG TPA: MoaD/ThiS family protein [Acidimicrobiales bacterium]|nr:MoaD/ThiS family protein [Acidimicrobiales bacterium]
MRLAATLRAHAGGESSVDLDLPPPVTIGAVIDALTFAHPAIGRRIRDEAGAVRRHVNVFVGEDNVRHLADTVVPEGVEVTVLPAVSGG